MICCSPLRNSAPALSSIALAKAGSRPARSLTISLKSRVGSKSSPPAQLASQPPSRQRTGRINHLVNYDAGVRLGEQLAKDMIAAPLGPPLSMAVVAAPSYFERHPVPQTPQDLTSHHCINFRLPTYGGQSVWEFDKDRREMRVRVEGQLVFNNAPLRLASVCDGLDIAYMPEDFVLGHIADGKLIRVFENWCEPFADYHLYYPPPRMLRPPSRCLSTSFDAGRPSYNHIYRRQPDLCQRGDERSAAFRRRGFAIERPLSRRQRPGAPPSRECRLSAMSRQKPAIRLSDHSRTLGPYFSNGTAKLEAAVAA